MRASPSYSRKSARRTTCDSAHESSSTDATIFSSSAISDGKSTLTVSQTRFHFNGETPVHEPVPHSNDVCPRDRSIISLKILAYGRGGLTDDFDAFDKGESEHPVGFEVASRSASCKFDRVARRVKHVAKPE